MGVSVADVTLLLDVMRGPVEGDPTAAATWTSVGGMPSRVFAVPRTWDWGPLPAEVEGPYRLALDAIEQDIGLPVEEVTPQALFPTAIANGGEPARDWYVTVIVEELHWLGREWVQAHLEEFSAPFRGEMEDALTTSIDRYMAARHRRYDYAHDLDRLLGADAVLVCPTHGYQGWMADGMLPGTNEPVGSEGYNTGEFNMSGHPSLAIPAGMCSNGLPFGLEVNGPRWRDDIVLAFAEAWERERPWPLSAPGYEPFPVP